MLCFSSEHFDLQSLTQASIHIVDTYKEISVLGFHGPFVVMHEDEVGVCCTCNPFYASIYISIMQFANMQCLGVRAIGKVRQDQLIGEYVGGVEFAEDFKFSEHNDIMSLLDADHSSLGRCAMC